MKKIIFTGAATALVTPMTPAGKLNLPLLRRLTEWQIACGIDALVPCGTTGECATLSPAERRLVIETVTETAAGRVPVIAGAGCNDTKKAQKYIIAAQKAAADALLLVTPYYNKCTQKGLVEHFYRLADTTDLPVILYNVPSRTGVNISLEARVALSRHPNIAGIKEAGSDLPLAAETIAACGDNLTVYSGNDDLILPILSLGGKGVISVASNVSPGGVHRLCSTALTGDWDTAQTLYYSLLPLFKQLFCEVNPIPVKAAMVQLGFPCGDCRMPLGKLDEKYQKSLSELIQKYKLLSCE